MEARVGNVGCRHFLDRTFQIGVAPSPQSNAEVQGGELRRPASPMYLGQAGRVVRSRAPTQVPSREEGGSAGRLGPGVKPLVMTARFSPSGTCVSVHLPGCLLPIA